MLSIRAELIHGTIRATSYEDTTVTGNTNRSEADLFGAEWPPSPCRVLSALVAADGTRDRARVSDGRELAALETSEPPEIIASAPRAVLATRLRDRFVVVDNTFIDNKNRTTGSVQEYVGRTAAAARPGARLAPMSRHITYVWPNVRIAPPLISTLKARAARVGYLGCSDSPIRLTVAEDDPGEKERWLPDDDGTVVLPVPYPGFIDALDLAFDRFRAGQPQRRSWIPNRYARYRAPGDAAPSGRDPTVLWLRFENAVSGRRLLTVTEALRAALLERYTLDIGNGDRDAVPPVLTGHGFEGRGYDHAHFLALPDVGHRYARGALHGCAVILPPGTSPAITEAVHACLWRLRDLVRPGSFGTRVRLFGGEPTPRAANPRRWVGPSIQWVSATPVIYERFARRGLNLDEVGRLCESAGIAGKPVTFRFSEVPLGPGALSLKPHEVYRAGKPKRPYGHLAVVFDRPVEGPLVLGGGRHFGLGLMYPVEAER